MCETWGANLQGSRLEAPSTLFERTICIGITVFCHPASTRQTNMKNKTNWCQKFHQSPRPNAPYLVLPVVQLLNSHLQGMIPLHVQERNRAVNCAPKVGSHGIHIAHQQATWRATTHNRQIHVSKSKCSDNKKDQGHEWHMDQDKKPHLPLEPPRIAKDFGLQTPVETKCSPTAIKSS